MKIGIDFDNTIICYDQVFNAVGIEKGLVPEGLHVGKGFVRDYLRKAGKEKEWVWLQGYVYGTRLSDATPYDGIHNFLKYCKSIEIECVIVSHKTIYPYSGDTYNLHNAAFEWIKEQHFGLETFFELTKENKVKRISELGCTVFIDDLPEFLTLPGFPVKLFKILFDPLKKYGETPSVNACATNWREILSIIKELYSRAF